MTFGQMAMYGAGFVFGGWLTLFGIGIVVGWVKQILD